MKRKNKKLSRITSAEELQIVRRYCWEENQSFSVEGHYMVVRDVLECSDCIANKFDLAINLYMHDEDDPIDKNDVVVITDDDLSGSPELSKLPYDNTATHSVYLLDSDVLEGELSELRIDYRELKRCLAKSKYKPSLNLLPLEADPESTGVKAALVKTELGNILYWGPLNWYVITDIDYEDYMHEVRDSLVFVPLKDGGKDKSAVFLGGDFESEVRSYFDEEIAAYKFFTPDVLVWTKKKLEELDQRIKEKKKSML